MINKTFNIKHKLIIQLGYATGLRVSEIINLKWKDIDFDRNIIHIKQAKGRKDRVIMLSEKIKETLCSIKSDEGYVFFNNEK